MNTVTLSLTHYLADGSGRVVLRGLSQPEVNAYITRFQGGRYVVTEEKEN